MNCIFLFSYFPSLCLIFFLLRERFPLFHKMTFRLNILTSAVSHKSRLTDSICESYMGTVSHFFLDGSSIVLPLLVSQNDSSETEKITIWCSQPRHTPCDEMFACTQCFVCMRSQAKMWFMGLNYTTKAMYTINTAAVFHCITAYRVWVNTSW